MTVDPHQLASGSLIEARRRRPVHCVYCSDAATSREHALTEALGGRLWARVLCAAHNGIVERHADGHLNKTFAPYVTMLQVARQRGGSGAEFIARDDDGKPITIVREGFAKPKRLEVRRVDGQGRILHAVGDLDILDQLPPQSMSPEGKNHVIAFVENPTVNVIIAADGSIEGALLKIGLHTYASFVDDVPIDIASGLLPFITGKKRAGGMHVRTPFLREALFPDSWPARHEVTCYPYGDDTLVTILLFGAYAYTCRLPLRMPTATGFRYTQMLDENFPRVQEDVAVPTELDWEDRPGLYDAEAFAAPVRERVSRLHAHGAEQSVRARCQRAAERARGESSNFGNLWERYAAALALECFDNTEIQALVSIARRLRDEGKPIWEVPVRIGVENNV